MSGAWRWKTRVKRQRKWSGLRRWRWRARSDSASFLGRPAARRPAATPRQAEVHRCDALEPVAVCVTVGSEDGERPRVTYMCGHGVHGRIGLGAFHPSDLLPLPPCRSSPTSGSTSVTSMAAALTESSSTPTFTHVLSVVTRQLHLYLLHH